LDQRSQLDRFLTYETFYIGLGFVTLCALMFVPIWNAVALLNSANYVFWFGRYTPLVIITVLVCIVFLYIVVMSLYAQHARDSKPHTGHSVRNEQTIFLVGTIFATLLGFCMMMLAMPLVRDTTRLGNELSYRCSVDGEARQLFEYSYVLHNIRAHPLCANKVSVEHCRGYDDAPPYTDFLKTIESDYSCTGFCHQVQPSIYLETDERTTILSNKTKRSAPAGLLQVDEGAATEEALAGPGTRKALFSTTQFRASCDSMLAQDLRHFAGDIGLQMFYQGLFLVVVAVLAGFLKLLTFCWLSRESEGGAMSRDALNKGGSGPGASWQSESRDSGSGPSFQAPPAQPATPTYAAEPAVQEREPPSDPDPPAYVVQRSYAPQRTYVAQQAYAPQQAYVAQQAYPAQQPGPVYAAQPGPYSQSQQPRSSGYLAGSFVPTSGASSPIRASSPLRASSPFRAQQAQGQY